MVLGLFAICVLLLFGAVGEIVMRLAIAATTAAADPRCAGAETSQASQKGLYVPDPEAGYGMRPNICVRLRTGEYDEVLRTNAYGFAGPDLPPIKPAGEFRIVVLG